MALHVTNSAELYLLDQLLKDSSGPNFILHLYQNNYTPDDSTVVGSFTEASFTNYVAVTLVRSSWGASTTVGGAATSVYPSCAYTSGSSQTVYGYYISKIDNTSILWSELWSSPEVLNNGDVLNVQPKLNLASAS